MTAKPSYEELERRVQELESLMVKNITDDLSLKDGLPELADAVDIPTIQSLMDHFFALTNIGVAIMDLKGNILVATGWQDICTRFHRVHPETYKNCLESDLILSNGVEPGTFKLYQCKNHMWDMATPIMAGNRKVGNLFLGQFLFEDELPDIKAFRNQARQYGFDEDEYISALENVPRWTRETVNEVMEFYTKLANLISDLGYKKLLLNESEALLSRSQEISHTGSWKLNLIENCLTWSDEVYRIFGYEPQEFPASYEAFLNAVHPDDRSAVDEAYSSSLREGSAGYEIKHRVIQKNSGEIRYVRERCIHESNNAGTIIQSIGMVQDITEGQRVQKVLQESEEKFRLAFHTSPDSINLNRLEDGVYIDINDGFTKITGYTQQEVLGKSSLELNIWTNPKDRQRLVAGLKTHGVVENLEAEFTDKNGQIRTGLMSARILHINNEDLILSITRDITKRKEVEEEKEKLQTQLNQAQKMESVGRLAGGVAHDFNNMLGVILGHTELALLQADEKHDLYSDLIEIQKAAKRSANITKQLLAFARKQTISPRKLDLNDTVESMLNMLRRLIGEDIDLAWQPSAHLWPVKMDPSQIDQILANLCVNARDAISGVGKLTIETGKKSFDEAYCSEHPGFIPGDFVLLAVSDNGCGMDKETLENLFEPFFTTKSVGKGTGLGLATIYGIVKQNNGFINVYSEPGQGSTFRIYLPRLAADGDIDKAVPEKKTAVGGTETILLVEDEPTILRMTRIMLERKGYSVLPAATPGEAIDLAKTHADKIHLLMTDVVMPEMNGRDLAGKITPLYPEIKLLFMSGYTANVIAHHGVLDEGVAFIQKPFSMADMTEKVREVLDMASDKNQG